MKQLDFINIPEQLNNTKKTTDKRKGYAKHDARHILKDAKIKNPSIKTNKSLNTLEKETIETANDKKAVKMNLYARMLGKENVFSLVSAMAYIAFVLGFINLFGGIGSETVEASLYGLVGLCIGLVIAINNYRSSVTDVLFDKFQTNIGVDPILFPASIIFILILTAMNLRFAGEGMSNLETQNLMATVAGLGFSSLAFIKLKRDSAKILAVSSKLDFALNLPEYKKQTSVSRTKKVNSNVVPFKKITKTEEVSGVVRRKKKL